MVRIERRPAPVIGAEDAMAPDARGIARIARNPCCQLQAAMIVRDLPESQIFEILTNQPYLGPLGERTAATRWGTLFDTRLTEDRAMRLREALDGVCGITAATATVCDLRRDVPGTRLGALLERNRRTRGILTNLLADRPVPDILIQPPLQLDWGRQHHSLIIPDALICDRTKQTYHPLEAKGYIAVDGVVAPGDRASLRLQAAVQIVALELELSRLDPGCSVVPRALLVVATPFGFHPAPAILEDLGAEVTAVQMALRVMARVASRLATVDHARPLRETLTRLPIHYQEQTCLTSCALMEVCRCRAGVRGALGDDAARLFGEDLDLARVIGLVSGDPPTTVEELTLLTALRETAALFSWRWES
jgi:hypothetical protein